MGLRNYRRHWTTLLFFILPIYLFSQDFKVIGYLPHFYFEVADEIDYSKLTHLNLAFANPDKYGNLDLKSHQIQPIVRKAHLENTKVCVSLGGGALLPEWWSAWQHLLMPKNRSAFINKLVKYLKENNLQGIDVDLEWKYVNKDYSGFVLELRDSLDLHDLILTAALPAIHRYPNISNEALAVFDWINVMAYDLTGPWSPKKSAHHSPYSFAERSINYWQSQGVEGHRLTLGLPIYGWNFSNPKNVHSVSFGELISLNPSNGFLDQIGSTYFNGIPTIKAKTKYAKDVVSGVMLWQLGQDAFNEYSLLKAVDEEVNKVLVSYTPQPKITEKNEVKKKQSLLEIYPNPFAGMLHIQPENRGAAKVILTDYQGKKVLEKDFSGKGVISINSVFLSKGFYTLTVINEENVEVRKLIKS